MPDHALARPDHVRDAIGVPVQRRIAVGAGAGAGRRLDVDHAGVARGGMAQRDAGNGEVELAVAVHVERLADRDHGILARLQTREVEAAVRCTQCAGLVLEAAVRAQQVGRHLDVGESGIGLGVAHFAAQAVVGDVLRVELHHAREDLAHVAHRVARLGYQHHHAVEHLHVFAPGQADQGLDTVPEGAPFGVIGIGGAGAGLDGAPVGDEPGVGGQDAADTDVQCTGVRAGLEHDRHAVAGARAQRVHRAVEAGGQDVERRRVQVAGGQAHRGGAEALHHHQRNIAVGAAFVGVVEREDGRAVDHHVGRPGDGHVDRCLQAFGHGDRIQAGGRFLDEPAAVALDHDLLGTQVVAADCRSEQAEGGVGLAGVVQVDRVRRDHAAVGGHQAELGVRAELGAFDAQGHVAGIAHRVRVDLGDRERDDLGPDGVGRCARHRLTVGQHIVGAGLGGGDGQARIGHEAFARGEVVLAA